MSTPVKIEKGVPIPPKLWKKPKYPFRQMEVGDSIVMPLNSLSATYSCARSLGFKFVSRKLDAKTLRVWRVS